MRRGMLVVALLVLGPATARADTEIEIGVQSGQDDVDVDAPGNWRFAEVQEHGGVTLEKWEYYYPGLSEKAMAVVAFTKLGDGECPYGLSYPGRYFHADESVDFFYTEGKAGDADNLSKVTVCIAPGRHAYVAAIFFNGDLLDEHYDDVREMLRRYAATLVARDGPHHANYETIDDPDPVTDTTDDDTSNNDDTSNDDDTTDDTTSDDTTTDDTTTTTDQPPTDTTADDFSALDDVATADTDDSELATVDTSTESAPPEHRPLADRLARALLPRTYLGAIVRRSDDTGAGFGLGVSVSRLTWRSEHRRAIGYQLSAAAASGWWELSGELRPGVSPASRDFVIDAYLALGVDGTGGDRGPQVALAPVGGVGADVMLPIPGIGVEAAGEVLGDPSGLHSFTLHGGLMFGGESARRLGVSYVSHGSDGSVWLATFGITLLGGEQ